MPSLPSAPWAGQLPTEPAPWTRSLTPDIFSRGSQLPSGGTMRASGSIAIQPSHPIWMVSHDFAIPFVSCFACFCFYFMFCLKKQNHKCTRTHSHTHTHAHTRTHIRTQMTALQTMPQCCRCNGSGRCVSCACARAKVCTNCLPSKRP